MLLKLSREVKTAIIVLVGIFLFILGYGYLKSNSIFDSNKTLHAVYDHVGGIQSGTQVTINGVVIGNVTKIELKNSKFQSVVTFSIEEKHEFSKNSRAEIYDTGIIGGKSIQIIPVFDDAPMTKSGDTLPSSMKPGITALVQEKLTPLQSKVEGAVSHADTLLMNVNDILDAPTKRELRQGIAGLNQLIANFQNSANKLNQILSDNQQELDGSIKNFNTMTANFAKLSESLSNAGLDKTVTELQASLSNLNKTLQKIEKGEGSLGKMMNDDEFYTNLTAATRELDLFLQDFRLNPKRYVNVSVFGKKQKEYVLPVDDPAEKATDN